MTINPELMRAEKTRVARNSVLVAIVITVFKFIVGILSGSLGILSEALHSSLDLVAAIVTLFSVRVSDKPADADHQYGHGKIENFSAFIETGLLLITCVWIVWEAIHRLFFRNVEIEPSIWAVLVMSVSIVLDYWRSRALKRVADKYSSQALQADALHFATDIWSSAVVIAGLGFVWAGRHYHVGVAGQGRSHLGPLCGRHRRLGQLAPARETLDALLDAAPAGVRNEIIAQVGKRPRRPRSRARPHSQGRQPLLCRCCRGLARNLTFQASDAVVSEVRQRIRQPAGRLRRAGQRRPPRTRLPRAPSTASAPPRCATISWCMTSACRISTATFTSNCTSNSTRR